MAIGMSVETRRRVVVLYKRGHTCILKENEGMFKDEILASNLKTLKKLVEIYDI